MYHGLYSTEGCDIRDIGRVEAADEDIGPNADLSYFINDNE